MDGGKAGEEGGVGGRKELSPGYRGSLCRRNVWLTPLLLGVTGGRILCGTKFSKSRSQSLDRLYVPHDLAIISYGYSRGEVTDRPVNVLVKVPQGVPVSLAGRGTGGGSPGDIGDTGNGGVGSSGVTTAAGGLTDGCWPGVVLVAVHKFECSLSWRGVPGRYRVVLPRLNADMRNFVGWRLFAYEVVSAKGTSRGGKMGGWCTHDHDAD
jgi:hypothetical protein